MPAQVGGIDADIVGSQPAERVKTQGLTVQALIAEMESSDDEAREDAMEDLLELIESVYGQAGADLGQQIRDCGGITTLAWMLADPAPAMRKHSLAAIANLPPAHCTLMKYLRM